MPDQQRPPRAGQNPLIDEVIALFQPRTAEPLTLENGREIYENLTGFFATLMDIKAARDASLQGGRA